MTPEPIAPVHPPAPVIVGPTAGGKTAVGVEVCLELENRTGVRGEVVTCDAFQVYRGMDIGTAKPDPDERRGVEHHLIDLLDPADPGAEPYSVRRWLGDADRVMGEIRGRGAVPVVVGGTHLFVKALFDGLFEGPPADEKLREQLHAMDPAERRAELERVDPAAARRIHFNDARRSVRAIEVFRLTGKPLSEHQSQWDSQSGPRSDLRLFGLVWDAEPLNARINERVRQMLAQGLLTEARGLFEAGSLSGQAGEALGYKQLLAHFEGRLSESEAVEQIKIETRRFGKNQRTWLRRLRSTPGSVWIEAENHPAREISQLIVNSILTT